MIMKIIGWSVLALIAVLVAVNWRKFNASYLSAQRFLREVKIEMQKVSWPTRNDVIGSTIVVLTAVVFLTLAISAWDQILSVVLNLILARRGA